MEKELLRKFEIASEDEDDIDFDMMNQIAQILFEYNEGINVIQTFVIKNDIVIENEEKSLDEQGGRCWRIRGGQISKSTSRQHLIL